jgi:hypothetical protein
MGKWCADSGKVGLVDFIGLGSRRTGWNRTPRALELGINFYLKVVSFLFPAKDDMTFVCCKKRIRRSLVVCLKIEQNRFR